MEENKKPTENQNNPSVQQSNVTQPNNSSTQRPNNIQPNNTQPNNPNVNKVVNDAKNSMLNNKADKSADSKVKRMTAYQEQMLQETTKSKSNKKLVIIIVVVAVILMAGVGVALAFILGNKEEEPASVACDISVVAYYLDRPNYWSTVGVVDEFHFDKDTKGSISYTRAVNAEIGTSRDFVFSYEIDNTTDQQYSYFVDISGLQIQNCEIKVFYFYHNDNEIKENNEKELEMLDQIFELSTNKDVTINVHFSVVDTSIANEINTGCTGALTLTLSV